MIERKIQKQPTKAPAVAHTKGPVTDLLALLQKSLRENADKRKKPVAAKARGTSSLVRQKRGAGLVGKN